MVLPSHQREFYLNPSIIFREPARTSNTTHVRRPNLASCPDQHDPGLSWRSLARKRTRSSCALPDQALERDAAWKKVFRHRHLPRIFERPARCPAHLPGTIPSGDLETFVGSPVHSGLSPPGKAFKLKSPQRYPDFFSSFLP